ncbi:MAG: OmpL47-type beta-barrel domain-containing protein, partial [Anaerolineae bacterium]
DITAPAVTGVTSTTADGAYTVGANIDIAVQFSEAVVVNIAGGAPTLALETGATDRAASYVSGSGSDVLTFRYTVQAGDTSPDLDYTGASALGLHGATTRDAAGNDADLALPVPGTAGSLGAKQALVIDTTAPTTSLNALGGTSGANGWYTVSPSISLNAGDHTGGSGVAAIQYQFVAHGEAAPSNGSLAGWTVYSGAFTAPAGGHDLYAFSVDNVGNREAPANLGEFQVDGAAPATTARASTGDGSYDFGNWTNLSVTVALSGDDGSEGSGVNLVYYAIDGAAPVAYDASNKPVISTEGIHSITFWSADIAGNVEDGSAALNTASVKIDKTAPTAEITSGPDALTASTGAEFVFSGGDAASGLDHIECQLDGGGWASCISPWTHAGTLSAGDHIFEVRAVDVAGNVGPATPVSYTWHINAAPGVSNNWGAPAPNVQYSDAISTVTITATDVDTAGSRLSASASFKTNGGDAAPGLPAGLSLSMPAVASEGPASTVNWTVSGQMLVPAGTYEITVGVSDGLAGPVTTSFTIVVGPEDARVRFHGGNPVAVRVASDGGSSGAFSLEVAVREAYDAASGLEPYGEPGGEPGSIDLAQVRVVLVPVAPGGQALPRSCSRAVYNSGYDARLAVTCLFDQVPVNTYVVQVTVDGGSYAGSGEDVLSVYDPSLGYATGAVEFDWLETDEDARAGFTMAYNRKGTSLSGSLLLTRHTADGETLVYQVKSNALYGLSLGGDASMGWATFSGKCTYLGPGMGAPEGNHEFTVYALDYYDGRADRFWIEVRGKDGQVIAAASLPREATLNAQEITEGAVVVPYTGAKVK